MSGQFRKTGIKFGPFCLSQILHKEVALGIDVGPDMVGDLPRIMAQTHPTIERD